MSKHRQNKSLGSVASFVSSDNAQETQETSEQRIIALERRVATLETLLNDVMIQLDKPFKKRSTPKPKPKKEPKPTPPVLKSEIEQTPQAKTEFHNQKQKRASEAALASALESVKGLLSDGVKRTRAEILKELPNVSKRKFSRLSVHLVDDGNENYEKRLYFMEDPKK